MATQVVVSVVMGVFNEEKVIARSLQSIINQSFVDWELIVVDDGSTDQSREIIESFISQDNRIILIQNKTNLGHSTSLNVGMAIAKGKYIARMDADDESLPKRLESQTTFLELHPDIDILGTAAVYIDGQGQTLKEMVFPQWHEDILAKMLRTSPFAHPTIMMKRDFVEVMGGYDVSHTRGEDHDLWLRSRGIGKFHNLPEIHLRYLVSSKVMFRSLFDRASVRLKHSHSIFEYLASIFWSFMDLLVELRKQLMQTLVKFKT